MKVVFGLSYIYPFEYSLRCSLYLWLCTHVVRICLFGNAVVSKLAFSLRE